MLLYCLSFTCTWTWFLKNNSKQQQQKEKDLLNLCKCQIDFKAAKEWFPAASAPPPLLSTHRSELLWDCTRDMFCAVSSGRCGKPQFATVQRGSVIGVLRTNGTSASLLPDHKAPTNITEDGARRHQEPEVREDQSKTVTFAALGNSPTCTGASQATSQGRVGRDSGVPTPSQEATDRWWVLEKGSLYS